MITERNSSGAAHFVVRGMVGYENGGIVLSSLCHTREEADRLAIELPHVDVLELSAGQVYKTKNGIFKHGAVGADGAWIGDGAWC